MNLISRKMLTPDEVLMFENPNALVMIAGNCPAITNIPDISQTYFNDLLGMGTEEENQKLRIQRENSREIRQMKPIKIWDIWKKTSVEEKQLEIIQNNFIRRAKGEK